MPFTNIRGNQIASYTINTEQLSNTATAAFAKTLAPKILYANVASNNYTILDDAAVNVGGGYIVITGAEFQSGATVLIDTTQASAVSYINSTTLRAQVPAKSAASYNLYVVNPDGGTGLKVAGITYSSEPTWVTTSPLANVTSNSVFSGTFSATSATSYANTTILPTGFTLLSNGYYYGNISVGTATTYNFDIKATDAELQDSTKSFSLTAILTQPLPTNVVFYMSGQGTVGTTPQGKFANGSSYLFTQAVGTVNYSSAQAKYGTTSVGQFSNTNRRIQIASDSFAFGTGDFTVEAWFWVTSALAERAFFAFTPNPSTGSTSGGFDAVTDNSRKFFLNINGGYATTDGFAAGGGLNTNAWNHLAVSRSSGTFRTFVNGVSYQSTINNVSFPTGLWLAIGSNGGNWLQPDFYVNDLRVSNIAQYTGNFTPPAYFNY